MNQSYKRATENRFEKIFEAGRAELEREGLLLKPIRIERINEEEEFIPPFPYGGKGDGKYYSD